MPRLFGIMAEISWMQSFVWLCRVLFVSECPNIYIYILFGIISYMIICIYCTYNWNVLRIFSLNPHDDILIFSGENDNAEYFPIAELRSANRHYIMYLGGGLSFPAWSVGRKYRAQWQLDSTIKMIDWTKPNQTKPKCVECEVSAK